jgi:quinol-cytochrome oxidoreductase complex cytochrome b subunit
MVWLIGIIYIVSLWICLFEGDGTTEHKMVYIAFAPIINTLFALKIIGKGLINYMIGLVKALKN